MASRRPGIVLPEPGESRKDDVCGREGERDGVRVRRAERAIRFWLYQSASRPRGTVPHVCGFTRRPTLLDSTACCERRADGVVSRRRDELGGRTESARFDEIGGG